MNASLFTARSNTRRTFAGGFLAAAFLALAPFAASAQTADDSNPAPPAMAPRTGAPSHPGSRMPIVRPLSPNSFGVRVPLQTSKPFSGGFANPWGINKTSTPLTRNLVTLQPALPLVRPPHSPRPHGWTHGPKRPAIRDDGWNDDGWNQDKHDHGFDDGLTIHGSYKDDRWKLRFHLGGSTHWYRKNTYCQPIYWPTWGWGGGLYYNSPLGWLEYRDATYYPSIDGYYSPADPDLYVDPAADRVEAPAPPPTEPEALGRWHLEREHYREAVEAFAKSLDEKRTPERVRWLGLAYLMDRKPQEAAALIAAAYSGDPTLASRPIPDDALVDREEFRRARTMASRYANQMNSASGWLTLVVLLQAEGKNDLARTNLKKAQAVQLETPVARAIESALK